MTTRKLNGPFGGDYQVDGEGSAVPLNESPLEMSDSVSGLSNRQGRSRLTLYDDFSGYANGSIVGQTTDVGNFPWAVSGAVSPIVTSGTVGAAGSGYLYTTDSNLPFLVGADIAFGSTGTGTAATLAFSADRSNLLNNLLHCIYGPHGYTLTIRRDAGTFYTILGGRWRSRLKNDGTVYHFALSFCGNTCTVYGPHGEAFSVSDRRISEIMASNDGTMFWQATTNTTPSAKISRTWAMSRQSTGYIGVADYLENIGITGSWDYDQYIGSRNTPAETRIGTGVSSQNPAIVWGPVNTISMTLYAAVSAGATSFQTTYPLPGSWTVLVGSGTNEETVTTNGYASGSSEPFTSNITGTFASSWPAGTALTVTPAAGYAKQMYLNPGNGSVVSPSFFVLDPSSLYVGTGLDIRLQRAAADVLAMGSGDSFKVDGTYNGGTLRMGNYYLWVDGSDRLRIKSGAPSTDTDGTIVGTQS